MLEQGGLSPLPSSLAAKNDCKLESCVLLPVCRDNGHVEALGELKYQRRALSKMLSKFLETQGREGDGQRGEQQVGGGGTDDLALLDITSSGSGLSSPSSKNSTNNNLVFSHTTVIDVLPSLDPVALKQYEHILAAQRVLPLSGKHRMDDGVRKAQSVKPRPWDPPPPPDSDQEDNDHNIGEGSSGGGGALVLSAASSAGATNFSSGSNNRIRNIPWCPWLVTTLTITHNYQLSQLPLRSMLELVNLRELNLSYNAIKVFPPALCSKLSPQQEDRLWDIQSKMAENPGKIAKGGAVVDAYAEIEATVSPFPELTKLNLDNNLLVLLPKQIGCLKKLRSLSLENNQLVGLPNELQSLPVLEELRVGNNNFVNDQEGGDGLDYSTEGEDEEEDHHRRGFDGDDDDANNVDPSYVPPPPMPMPSGEYLDVVLPYHCRRPTVLLEALVGHQASIEHRVCRLLEEDDEEEDSGGGDAIDRTGGLPLQLTPSGVSGVSPGTTVETTSSAVVVRVSPSRVRGRAVIQAEEQKLPSATFDLKTSRCTYHMASSSSHRRDSCDREGSSSREGGSSLYCGLPSERKGIFSQEHRDLLLNTYLGGPGANQGPQWDWGRMVHLGKEEEADKQDDEDGGEDGAAAPSGGDYPPSSSPPPPLLPAPTLLGPLMKKLAGLTGPCCSLCGREFSVDDFNVAPPQAPLEDQSTTTRIVKTPEPPTAEQKEYCHYQKPLGLVTFADVLGNKSVPLVFFACGWRPPAAAPAGIGISSTRGGQPKRVKGDAVVPVDDDVATSCASIIVRDVMEATFVNYSKLNYDVYVKTPTS